MSLSSLIVQREVATMRQVEEALARQVIYGGDLATNLLEVAPVNEGALTNLIAESMGLDPAPAGELPLASEPARVVPPEMAAQREIVPLTFDATRLVLAVASPLPRDVEEQLSFVLGVGIEQRFATAVRVRQALTRLYGVPLERRMQRLVARLASAQPAGSATPPSAPDLEAVPPAPAGALKHPPERQRPGAVTPPLGSLAAPVPGAADEGPLRRRTSTSFPAAPGGVAPAAGSSPGASPVATASGSTGPGSAAATSTAPAATASVSTAPVATAPVATAPVATAPVATAPVAIAPVASAPGSIAPAPTAPVSITPLSNPPAAPERPASLLQRTVAAAARAARRRRGPLTLEAVKREVREATDRDTCIHLFFDFSRQFFEYAALFLVHGDIAEGFDAFGSGASREKVVGIGVPLDLPSLLAHARDERAPAIARPGADGLDGVLLVDLQRPRDAEVAVVPLVVRTRAVAVLLGDCGEAGVDRAAVQQIVGAASLVGKALERIIVRRKLEGFIAAGKAGAPAGTSPGTSEPPPAGGANAAQPSPPSDPAGSPGDAIRANAPPRAAPPSADPAPPGSPTRGSLSPRQEWTSPETEQRFSSMPAMVSASWMPPPPPNAAAVRTISGPPIPREDPESAPGARQSGNSGAGSSASSGNGESGERLPSGATSDRRASRSASEMPVAQAAPGTLEDAQAAEAARAEAPIPQELDARALFDILGWETGAEPPEAPPPSSSFAVPPHHPPASRTSSGSELPSVIVDLDLELATMIDRVASGQADESAEAELLRQGDRAMRVVRTRFPGPVTFERARIATSPSPPRASECGPLLRLVARERKVALPFVLDWMSDRDPETRGWATHLVCELPYAEAIPHVLARLRDDDAAIRISAALAVSALGKVAPGPLADAIQPLASSADPDDRVSAIKAMAALRQANVVPQLLTALGDADPKVGSAARDALVQITWQDFDADADAWLRWWEQNGARHRIEWLIDSLTHEEAEIRRGSGEELRTLTREYFGYSGDLPPRDRDRAQQRYRDWWLTEGRNRFRRR